jgi:hypothetical protein
VGYREHGDCRRERCVRADASVTPQDRSFWVTVDKPGFETSELARSIDSAGEYSLRLHQTRTIPSGSPFQGGRQCR